MNQSLFTALLANVDENAAFLTVPGQGSKTYGQITERSADLAGALQSLEVSLGDRVVVQVDKSPDAVALYLACLRSGIVYVPINTAYTPSEVAYFVDDAEATLLICRPADEQTLADAVPEVKILTLDSDGGGSLAEAAATAEPFNDVVARAVDDLACMLYTSGTTGRSKGAMLTHLGLLTNGQALHEVWHFEPGDVLLHTLPIFHVHGLFVALHCAILNGSEVIFLPRFDVDEVIAQLPNSSVMMGVPTHYVRLLDTPRFGRAACEEIRLFTSGSAPMTEQVHAAFTERTGHHIVERYGMTECGIITSNPYDGDRIPGTVGHALPGVELRVRDGLVQVRGPHLFSGYWRMPEKTAEEFTDDGFFLTGDVGELADSGRLTLAGRSGDMIISGGFNVYPKEIELVLDETAGIVESAVIGVPHPDFGEGVVAVVVLEPGQDLTTIKEAADFGCGQHLARFKHPKRYIEVSELPRNTMGKVQKVALRAEYASLLSDPS